MRLLFVSQFVYKPDQPASNRIYDLLQELARRGHKPHVVAGGVHYLDESIDEELARKKLISTRWGDVEVTQVYASPNFRRGVISRLRSYFSFTWHAVRAILRVRPVDAILVSIQPFFIAPLAWLVSRVRRVPFIVEVRDLWPDAAAEVGLIRSRFLLWLGRRLELFVYRRASRLIVIGSEMKKAIVRKGIDPDKIEVFPQGYRPADQPVPGRELARKNIGIPEDAFVVMFTGSFGLANNDLPAIIEAASRLKNEPDLLFVMVGEGNQKAKCIERCEREGLDGVRFLPMVPKTEIPGLLAAGDAAIMTLPPGEFWRICLQNKFFDYLGNGLPLIAAVEGDQEHLLTASNGGVVVRPGDVDGIVEAILRLKSDPALRDQLGRNAAAFARDHLLRADILGRYVDLLEAWIEPRSEERRSNTGPKRSAETR